MSALVFSNNAKNNYLDTLTGKAIMGSYALGTYIQITTNAAVNLFTNAYGTAVSFAYPVAGTSVMSTASITPNVSGAASLMTWYGNASTSYLVATGTVSAAGGGGNFIVQSTSFTASTPVPCSCVIKLPTGNGGTLFMNQALVNAWLQIITGTATAVPAMASSGTMTFYSGTQPANADTAVTTQTALGSLTFAVADYSSAATGVAVLAAAKSCTPVATGTATWARWTRGTYTIDGSVGTTGADFIVATTSFVTATPVNLTGASLTFP
jgi:hypothetical protein